jgi:hypothetical protein
MPAPRPPPRLGLKFAALGIVGGAMVLLPLVQVLRYQNAQTQEIQTERAALDPMAHAVALERGLLAHRDLAGRVLRGKPEFEPQRRLRQGEVDDRVADLGHALAEGSWEQAQAEASALAEDWQLLARQVGSRVITAAESDQSHRLRVEQTLQVIDLVALALAAPAGSGTLDAAAARTAARAVPRLAWQLVALTGAGEERDAVALQRDLAVAEASLARTLGGLNRALARHPNAALAEASAAAGATADRYFQLLRAGSAADAQAAGTAALQAQFRLHALARDQAARALDLRLADTGRQRVLLGAVLAALLVALALLALVLARGLRAGRPPPAAPAPAPGRPEPLTRASTSRVEAGRLLQRLRQAEGTEAGGHAASDPRPTLPPQD